MSPSPVLRASMAVALAACDVTLPWSETEPMPLSASPTSVRFEKAIDDNMGLVASVPVAVRGGPPGASLRCTAEDPRVAEAVWMGRDVLVFPGPPAGLGVGTWSTRIWVAPISPPSQAPLAGWPPAAIDVSYVVRGPDLTFTPSALTFEVVEGMPLPPAQTIRIESAGGSERWDVSVWSDDTLTVPWVVSSATSGTTMAAEVAISAVSAPPFGPLPAAWTGRVQLSNGRHFGAVPVTVTRRLPHLAASPVALSFQVQQGQPAPPAQEVSLSYEAGAADLQIGLQIQGPSDWLSLTLPRTAPGALEARIVRTDLPAGRYLATVFVDVFTSVRVSTEVPIVLQVTP